MPKFVGHKPDKYTYRGLQDILKAWLSGRDKQFVVILMKVYLAASRYKY